MGSQDIGFEAFDEELARIRIEKIENDLAVSGATVEALNEAYSDAVRSMFAAEDIGWQRLSGMSAGSAGHDLDQAKKMAVQIGDWVETNPLLRNGKEIRNSYLFGQPYKIGTEGAETQLTPQQKNVIGKGVNQRAVFGLPALAIIEGQRYEAGAAFVLFDKPNKKFTQIPFDQIADIIVDPDDASELWYVQRSWSADVILADGKVEPREFKYWYPVSTYAPANRFVTKIKDVDVDISKRMIVSRVNTKPGYTLGIPDAFAAAPWALAYSAYLRDGTKVLAALAEWVWKITPKKRNAAERAAAAVRTERGAGGSLFTDMDVQALPTRDAVDLNTGRPLAAQVASSLGISIVALLSDPGQSGAFGTAQTLADPNRRTMQARRELNTEFLLECLRLIGITDPAISWAKMAPGTDKEESEIVAVAWGTGLFEPEEIRPRLAEIAHLELVQENAPEGVMIPNNIESLARADVDADAAGGVDADGTTSMTNGVGRDNRKQGALSRTASSNNQSGAE